MFDMFEMFNQDNEEKPQESSSSPTSPYSTGGFFSISVGGSVLIEDKPNVTKIAKFSESINRLCREGYKFALVLGGGRVCRNYQAAAKSLGASNYFLDEIGINVTRVNASLLTQTVDDAFPTVLTTVADAIAVIEQGRIPVMGGLSPGSTTDLVASLIAEAMNGTFINLSNVDGIYSSDPKRTKHAKFYPELSYERLLSIIQMAESKPGQNVVLDMPAVLVLKRSQIKSLFLDGNDLSNFEAAVRGSDFNGTIVTEEISESEAKITGKRIPRKKSKVIEDGDEEINPDDIGF